jgi:hypothetical protein
VAADTSPRARITADAAVPSARLLDVAAPSATAKVAIMLAREGMTDTVDAAATVDLADPAAATADAAITVGRDATATGADATVELGLVGPADPAPTGADATLAVGLSGLGDPAAAGADAAVDVSLPGLAVPAVDGVLPTQPALVGDISVDGLLAAIEPAELGVGDLVPATPVSICVGDCDADTGTGGTPPPTQPSPTPSPGDGTGGQDTSTGGIEAPGGTGLTGTSGMLASAAGAAGATVARLRSAVGGGSGGTLAFTGGASDLLAIVALGLLMVGALLLRAARPARLAERR